MYRTIPARLARRLPALLSAALLAVLAVGALPASAAAQGEPAWVAEVGAYRLSDDGVARFRDAIRSLVAAIEADPSINERGARTDGFDEAIAFMERDPAVSAALSAARMPAREYVLFSMAFMQAGVVTHMVDTLGEDSLDDLPPTVSRENVAYFRANREHLEQVAAEVQTLMQRMQGAHDDHAGHGHDH